MNKLNAAQVAYLDGVRGASALIVMVGHFLGSSIGDFSFGKTHPWQSLGVVVFFWLSGFLIAYNCMRPRDYGWGEYFIDRFSRIYVLYLPALAFTILSYWGTNGWMPSILDTVAHLLMLQHTPFQRIDPHLSTVPVLLGNSPLWTIAVEWWLYMMFGIIFFWARARGAARLGMAFLMVPAVLVTGYFLVKEYVAWAWVLGAISAFFFVRIGPQVPATTLALVTALAAIAIHYRLELLALPGVIVNMYDMQLVLAGAVLLSSMLLLLQGVRQLPDWVVRVTAGSAFVSYTLYLFHTPVGRVLEHSGLFAGAEKLAPVQVLVLAACTLLICGAIAWLLEERHVALRAALKARFLRPAAIGTRTQV